MLRSRVKEVLRAMGLLPTAKRIRGRVSILASGLRYRIDQLRYRYKTDAARLPIPPRRLNYLVTGAESVRWYVDSGRWAAQSITTTLERNLIPIDSLRTILDFGCGSGRVIRHWRSLKAEVFGTDYNSELVAWCRQYLGFAKFSVNQLDPPLPYEDQSFDLIYALSVFTHLDESRQAAWMAELARVLGPNGYLLFTTSGACPFYLKRLSNAELDRFQRGELVIQSENVAGTNTCAAYHPPEYVRGRLARDFLVVDHLQGGAFGNPYQDVYLLQKC